MADRARNYIKNNADYKLYSFKDSLAVCFNYKDYDPVDLCNKLYEKNKLMIGHGCFQQQRFIRLVLVNSENNYDDLKHFFEVIEDFAEKFKDIIKRYNKKNYTLVN